MTHPYDFGKYQACLVLVRSGPIISTGSKEIARRAHYVLDIWTDAGKNRREKSLFFTDSVEIAG